MSGWVNADYHCSCMGQSTTGQQPTGQQLTGQQSTGHQLTGQWPTDQGLTGDLLVNDAVSSGVPGTMVSSSSGGVPGITWMSRHSWGLSAWIGL